MEKHFSYQNKNKIVYTPEFKHRIRQRVKAGESRWKMAEELGVSHMSVWLWSRDLPTIQKGNPGIRGRTLELLQSLMDKGYMFSAHSKEFGHQVDCYRTLRKYFPVKRVKVPGGVMYVLAGREEEAFRAFVGRMKRRVVSHQELGCIRKAFGIADRRYQRLKKDF